MTTFRRLSLAATIATLVQITSGGIVRATGSGDACPDWPRCFGRWLPPLRAETLIEWSHRTIGATAILLVTALAVVAVARHRRARAVVVPSVLAVAGIFLQAALGAIVVASKGEGATFAQMGPAFVTFHIATAMALVGVLVFSTVNAFCIGRRMEGKIKEPVEHGTARLAVASAVSVFVLILVGAWVRGRGAGLAFADWPLMDGRLVPELTGPAVPHFIHRVAALVTGGIVGAFALRAVRARPRDAAVSSFASIAAGLFVAQALVGAAQVWTRLAAAPVAAHVALSSLLFSSLVAAVTVTRHLAACAVPSATEQPRVAERVRGGLRAYVQLTKPRIILLLLVTTVPTMVVAARAWPSTWLVAATLIGGTLAAGSANTINCYIDRDIDSVMRRTRGRPLPDHRVEPVRALAFGIALAVVSFGFMLWTVNLLSALLAQAAILFYVFVYTIGLKRSTPHNIVIGGAAGAVPCLVGWAAVTGSVGWEAVTLFAITFFWTPPHFWALAMRYAADYAAAGVPMMPVVAGPRSTQRQIVLYSLVTVGVTLLLYPVARMGAIYLAAAFVLGAWFIRHAVVLWRDGTPRAALGLFRYSISYLALLFAAIGVDAVVHIPT